MGQQQLLLVILVTILVGIATVVAINVFGSAANQANRDAVRQDLLQGASAGQAIWIKPVLLGGAGRDFDANMTDETLTDQINIPGRRTPAGGNIVTNENGVYTITIDSEDSFSISAVPSTWENTILIEVSWDTANRVWDISIDDGGEVDETTPVT